MNPVFNAAAYARASKEDTGSTIENQIRLIRNYAASMAEIRIVCERSDNGFSGIDFFRPSFGEMMKDIYAGYINCVIVKDLSRLGRNYIEVGELLDITFPRLGVRLISVNDRYDSLKPRNGTDEIIIPFKNLINEQYLRDFSVKIRSNLNVKRKNGDFVAAFAPYGYRRDENNKHKLAVDKHAAGVVRDIFRYKLEGMSGPQIACRLNNIGEPSPADYKKGYCNYSPQFQTHLRAKWSAVAVDRILSNPVYIGTLTQGKETTANYKIKKRIKKPKSEWYTVQNAHESIIDKRDFEIVSSLLTRDTRTPPHRKHVYPLSGILFCGDCHNSMVRTKSGKYRYYVCASGREKGKGCNTHCIRVSETDKAVWGIIKHILAYSLDIERCLEYMEALPHEQTDIEKTRLQIAEREREISSCGEYRKELFEDYKSGIISKSDYFMMDNDYQSRVAELNDAMKQLSDELTAHNKAYPHHEYFRCFRTVPELSRWLAVNLIERIEVFNDKRVSVKLRYRDNSEPADTMERRCD